MLALAKHLNAPLKGYVVPDHPVQKTIAATIERYCNVKMSLASMGIDGCSVPTWAVPLQNLAQGFASLLATPNAVGQRIAAAVRTYPFLIAGTGGFDTRIMQAVPRLFIKYGAEGVYCGAIPHAGLGFAMKCDDGSKRAVEVAAARMLSKLDVWTPAEQALIQDFTHSELRNWRKIEVGGTRANF